jgi:hypothetical protein
MEESDEEKWRTKSPKFEVMLTKPILKSPSMSSFMSDINTTVEQIAAELDEKIPYVAVHVPLEDIERCCPQILSELLPGWKNVDYLPCKDGITNKSNLRNLY